MDTELARQKRQEEIKKALGFIQSSLPYPEPGGYAGFLTKLVYNLFDEGSASVKEGDWRLAIRDFSEGLNVAHYAQAEALKIPSNLLELLYVNRAVAYGSIGEHERAIQDCDSVLALCNGSCKALYRKALCLKEMGHLREAYTCCTGCLLTAPNDEEVNKLAQELANNLGLKTRKAYEATASASGDSNGNTAPHTGETSGNGLDSLSDITSAGFSSMPLSAPIPVSDESSPFGCLASVDLLDSPGQGPLGPVSDHLGDSELIGDDLDSLLDCITDELEDVGDAFATNPPNSALGPIQRPFRSGMPALKAQLPPAFFTAASQLNSLDSFLGLGGGGGAPKTALDALDAIDAMDSRDNFSSREVGDVPKISLGTLDGLDALDSLSAPRRPVSSRRPVAPRRGVDVLDDLDFFDTLDNFPGLVVSGEAPGVAAVLGGMDGLDSLDTFSPLEGATAAKPVMAVGGGGLDSLSEFSLPGERVYNKPVARPTKSNHTTQNGQGSSKHSAPTQNPLAATHDFMLACDTCYSRIGPGVLDYSHQPELVHNCKRNILLCMIKATEYPIWKRVRSRPKCNKFFGSYVLCKEVLETQECKFGEVCTFAYCQEEIDVWTMERKGTLSRELMFDIKDRPVLTITQLLQLHNSMFMFLCQECYDSKPRIISKRNKENLAICSNLTARHPFDEKKCLVHVVRSTSVSYTKIRPLHALCQFDVCRHAIRYGCQREDSCSFAHSFIELKCWMLQLDSGITPQEIALESTRHWKKLEQNVNKQKPVNMPPPSGPGGGGDNRGRGGGGGGGDGKGLGLKMKFVCGQCWRDGLVSEPDKALKYCTAKARHGWTKERRVLLVKSLEKLKWVMVRPLPIAKINPLQYDICSHVVKQKKCHYIGNCTFAHSQEEKEVWTYMRHNNLMDMQQMYNMWLSVTNHSRQPDGTLLAQHTEERQIAMPTDYAEPMSGFHCRLCGRHSNSERQWQQHISSEKHKDRVFSCEGEDESLTWEYRFPGLRLALCPRLESDCPEGASCDYAHSTEELVEWQERRDFLRRKLAKAREDMLIMPDEFDFGKFNFLLQD